MSNQTILYQEHLKLNAKMVDFAGWQMPIYYGSQIEEHHYVRKDAGVFDVSHMCVIDLHGDKVKDFLQYLLANDVEKLKTPGKALYSCMLNHDGGVIDDLIVYLISSNFYRLVVNAGTREKDLSWIKAQAKVFAIDVVERKDFSILAIQGPNARNKVAEIFSEKQKNAVKDLAIFQGVECEGFWIARTGYTGEEGYEIILPNEKVIPFWQALLSAGIHACGLGARDTLRLEAGLNLYGSDMDENISPLEANLAWTIAWQPETRNFIGRAALEKQKTKGVEKILVGLVLDERGVLRSHQKVSIPNIGEGETTSGTFSPTIGKAIAFARIPNGDAQECLVDIRGKWVKVRIVKPPFVRNNKVLV